MALAPDQTVWDWGFNGYGELGIGTVGGGSCTCSDVPVHVLAPQGSSGYLSNVLAIAAGESQGFALTSNGVYAWGDGTTTSRSLPVQVVGPGGSGYLSGIMALASGDGFTLALRNDYTVWAWGDDSSGQLGATVTTTCSGIPCSTTPVQVTGLSGVDFIAAGADTGVALTSNDTVWTWGNNQYGGLGNGAYGNGANPTPRR